MPQEKTKADKITVSWDDLQTRKVDARIREQEAMARTREYARMDEASLPDATPRRVGILTRLWRNSVVALALFGLIGGLLAWACGQSLQFRTDLRADAADRMKAVNRIDEMKEKGELMPEAAERATAAALDAGRRANPYFAVMSDAGLTDPDKERRMQDLDSRERLKSFIGNILAYGVSGVMLAVFLAIAIPLTERNLPQVVVNGSVGAALGLLGGVVVSLFVDRLFKAVADAADVVAHPSRLILPRIAVWGTLGLFLTIAPGIVMRNRKKFVIGLFGGLIGGLIGGLAYDPVVQYTQSTDWAKFRPAELVAMAAIGLVAGLATGLIENVAKTGWVRVVAGLIAGKQFILYRNPTFVGSGPDCQIYLFKDPRIGRRHAAIHIVPGGFELENLPLGAETRVNGEPVERIRLKHGDRIQIGATGLVFQEKKPA